MHIEKWEKKVIDISSVIITTVQRINKSEPGSGIKILTYKKDRHVSITRIDDTRLQIEERGFEQRKFEIEEKQLKKAMKTLIKREFPRSRKVHLKVITQDR